MYPNAPDPSIADMGSQLGAQMQNMAGIAGLANAGPQSAMYAQQMLGQAPSPYGVASGILAAGVPQGASPVYPAAQQQQQQPQMYRDVMRGF